MTQYLLYYQHSFAFGKSGTLGEELLAHFLIILATLLFEGKKISSSIWPYFQSNKGMQCATLEDQVRLLRSHNNTTQRTQSWTLR